MHSILSLIYLVLSPLICGFTGTVFIGRTAKPAKVPGLLFHSVFSERFRFSMSSISLFRFNKIILYLLENGLSPVTISDTGVSCNNILPFQNRFLITFDDGCRSFFTNVFPLLEESGIKATVFPVAGFLSRKSTWDILPVFDHLTKSELREISDHGHEIGSHGMTHTDLTFLRDSRLSSEVNDSKKMLEDIIGKKVSAISFPYGSWNKRVWEQALSAGYSFATTYRGHRYSYPGHFPVYGVYNFDGPQSVLSRIKPRLPLSISITCAKIMAHFARGAPMWKFNKEYRVGGKK
jgi:peptidoglycan/xylan/chitin deacetylase (PgdA/CDA1 family)